MLLSGLARITVYFGMNKKVKEVRLVREFGIKEAKDKIKQLFFDKFL